MFSTSHVAANHAPQISRGRVADTQGAPETGGFNFMDYIMGLQGATSGNSGDLLSLNGVGGMPANEGAEALALEGSNKENESPWNQIFPGLQNPIAQNPIPTNELAKPIPETTENRAIPMPVNPSLGLLNDARIAKKADEALLAENRLEANTNLSSSNALRIAESLNPGKTEVSLNVPEERDAKIQDSTPQVSNDRKEEVAAIKRDVVLQKYAGPTKAQPAKVELTENQPYQHVASLRQTVGGESNEVGEIKSSRKGDQLSGADILANASTPTVNTSSQSVSASDIRGEKVAPSTMPEVMNRVESMIHNGGGKMTVSLNPPHLGQVEIQVTTRGNKVEVEMTSDNQTTKSLLEKGLGDLKSSMQANDLVLSKMEVHVSREMDNNFTPNPFFNGSDSQFNQSQGFQGREQSQSYSDRYSTNSGSNMPQTRTASAATPSGMRANSVGTGHVDVRI